MTSAAGFGTRTERRGGRNPIPAIAGIGPGLRDPYYDGSCVDFSLRLPLPWGVSMLAQVPAGTRLQALPW